MKKKLIVLGISLVIILVGIIMAFTLKFNLGFEYSGYRRIIIYMIDKYDLNDIEQIVKDNFDGKYEMSYIDEFEDTISIKAKGISDENLENMEKQLKEKYEIAEDIDNMVVVETPASSVYDLVKVYILPVIVTFAIALIYYVVAFRKLGVVKSLVEPAVTIIVIGTLYVSIIAICRIPVNEFTIPLGLLIYLLSLLGETIYLNEERNKLVSKKKK